MIAEIKKIFQSNTRSMEIFYLINDLKQVVRLSFYDSEFFLVKEFCEANNLSFAISDFKIIQFADSGKGGFSNLGIKVNPDDRRNGYRYIYVSKEKKLSECAKQAEHENNHKELGLLLGYPECCVNFFINNFDEQSKKQNDFVLPAIINSVGQEFEFHINIIARYFDYTLLNHFPCSFSCEKSIMLGKKYFEALKNFDLEFAKELEVHLKTAVVYTEYGGVYLLNNPKMENNIIFYDSVLGTIKGRIFNDLISAKKIGIMGNRTLRIMEKVISDEDLAVIVFR